MATTQKERICGERGTGMDRDGGEAFGLGIQSLSHCQGVNKRDRGIALQIAACLLCIQIDVVAFSGLIRLSRLIQVLGELPF